MTYHKNADRTHKELGHERNYLKKTSYLWVVEVQCVTQLVCHGLGQASYRARGWDGIALR
jgi:hypothetical protein